MRILLYAGSAPSRDQVISYAAPLLRAAATALTLVSGGGAQQLPLLQDAVRRLELAPELPLQLITYAGDAVEALNQAVEHQDYDLVLFGRLQPTLQRFFRGQRSKWVAQHIHPAALRVQGRTEPIQRVLLGSGGDPATLTNAAMVARLCAPLGVSVTVLHVISQQSLFFEGFSREAGQITEFADSELPEAQILRQAAQIVQAAGIACTIEVRVGSVIDEVVELAQQHDLLAVGAHRVGSPLDRLLLEDLADDLLDASPIPVLLIKPQVFLP